jgi:hypothetical protein
MLTDDGETPTASATEPAGGDWQRSRSGDDPPTKSSYVRGTENVRRRGIKIAALDGRDQDAVGCHDERHLDVVILKELLR